MFKSIISLRHYSNTNRLRGSPGASIVAPLRLGEKNFIGVLADFLVARRKTRSFFRLAELHMVASIRLGGNTLCSPFLTLW